MEDDEFNTITGEEDVYSLKSLAYILKDYRPEDYDEDSPTSDNEIRSFPSSSPSSSADHDSSSRHQQCKCLKNVFDHIFLRDLIWIISNIYKHEGRIISIILVNYAFGDVI